MILEGLVTTCDPDGSPHIAPMGPTVNDGEQQLLFRLFPTSQTYRNLLAHPEGVFHITDIELDIALAVIGDTACLGPPIAAEMVRGHVLLSCCRYFEFRLVSVDHSKERVAFTADIVARGRFRDFVGFNRARFAVVEAAILASRVGILPAREIEEGLARLKVLVEKTGDDRAFKAFDILEAYIQARLHPKA